MKALLQRVSEAGVSVEGREIAAIGPGLVVFLCAETGDTGDQARFLAAKTARLCIFADPAGRMNLSLQDSGGAALVISQFTLAANWRKGNRPGFSGAAGPKEGKRLYETFADCLQDEGVPVARGRFGADMAVRLVNDGPVTIWMDSRDK